MRKRNCCAELTFRMESRSDPWICARLNGRADAGCATIGLSASWAERVFAEKVSGAVTDRKALARAIATLGPEDVLLVTRLDRLARSTRDLLNVLDAGRQGRCGVQVHRGCLGRHDNTARAADAHGAGRTGRVRAGANPRPDRRRAEAAQARGVRFSRKLTLTPYQRQEALARRAQGEPLVEIARTFGVSHSTISRLHEANSF